MLWHLKQLLPLTYRTHYTDAKGKHFVVWKMWLGRSYSIDDYIIGQKGVDPFLGSRIRYCT